MTDDDPQHYYCPECSDSWCKWQKDPDNHQHKDAIPDAVAQIIKPVYEELSKDELLEKCLHGKTQNSNECFNNSLWRMAPKTDFSGLATLELSTHLAVLKYNEGMSAVTRVASEQPGRHSTKLAKELTVTD